MKKRAEGGSHRAWVEGSQNKACVIGCVGRVLRVYDVTRASQYRFDAFLLLHFRKILSRATLKASGAAHGT